MTATQTDVQAEHPDPADLAVADVPMAPEACEPHVLTPFESEEIEMGNATNEPVGSMALVLHAHLPYVRHPEYPHFLEEDWFYEALSETYIPLLGMMDRLENEGIPFALTMSITPPLCEMLADDLLRDRYEARLDSLVTLAEALCETHLGTPYQDASLHAYAEFVAVRDTWRAHQRNLISGFRHHQDRGSLTIVTCGATHGLLALTGTYEGRRAQIQVARHNYNKHFGRDPDGIWLGECAYQDGLDELLSEQGIRFVFLETHGVTYATPRPRFGHYRPIFTAAGVAAFGRDPACSRQVWSADEGYPGDPSYREFYRDAGWDAPAELLTGLLGDQPRKNVGLKLHRITGKVALHQKEPYVPAWASEKAQAHARHFLEHRVQQVRALRDQMGIEPLLMAPYDAELFGHWWYEGPQFIEALFRQAHDFPELGLTTPRAWLVRHPKAQVARPAPSSWGDKGYWDVWLNGENAWMYRHLHHAEERMVELASRARNPNELETRVLKQLGRELLLAQSSDWAFIVTMKTTVPYAVKRTRLHLSNFEKLQKGLVEGAIDVAFLESLEFHSPIFSEIDWQAWKGPETTPAQISLAGVASNAIP